MLMKVEQWLDSQLGIDIWNNKYKFENENFEEREKSWFKEE